MKYKFAFAFVAIASWGWGDRLFEIPTGSVLEHGVVRLEYDSPFSRPGRHTDWLEYGLTRNVEISAMHETIPGLHSRDGINAAYNIMPPITEDLPGISVGFRDVLNRTQAGRSYYTAFTWAAPLENSAAGRKYFNFHAGLGGGAIKGVFAGFDLPFTEYLSLQAEHDSVHVSAGLEWFPIRSAGVRLFIQGDRLQWGVTYSRRL